MNIERAIEMIDEYLLEPNNISREWVECLTLCRKKLKCGTWLINPDGYYPYCSECGEEPTEKHLPHFCPNCGASMKGGEIIAEKEN